MVTLSNQRLCVQHRGKRHRHRYPKSRRDSKKTLRAPGIKEVSYAKLPQPFITLIKLPQFIVPQFIVPQQFMEQLIQPFVRKLRQQVICIVKTHSEQERI